MENKDFNNYKLFTSAYDILFKQLNEPIDKGLQKVLNFLKEKFETVNISIFIKKNSIYPNIDFNTSENLNNYFNLNKFDNSIFNYILNIKNESMNEKHKNFYTINSHEQLKNIINDFGNNVENINNLPNIDFKNILVFPLENKKEIIGILSLYLKFEHQVNNSDFVFLGKLFQIINTFLNIKIDNSMSLHGKNEKVEPVKEMIFTQRIDLLTLINRTIIHKMNNILGVISLNTEIIDRHGENDKNLRNKCISEIKSSLNEVNYHLDRISFYKLLNTKDELSDKDFTKIINLTIDFLMENIENFNHISYTVENKIKFKTSLGNDILIQLFSNLFSIIFSRKINTKFPVKILFKHVNDVFKITITGIKNKQSDISNFFLTEIKNYNIYFSFDIIKELVKGNKVYFNEVEQDNNITFSLSFPDCNEKKDQLNIINTKNTKANNKNLLIIDDEKVFLELIATILKDKGFNVKAFSNPKAGLKELKDNHFKYNILLCDYNMPEISGEDFLVFIENKKLTIPVIMLSGTSTDLDSCEKYNCVKKTLKKPFNVDNLIYMLKGLN